ncbi:hypothetical protein DFQ26_002404 [Actinomortierella ambigua]|nr:hypothetical protein DFQ26_002404 [Actinomortierella ambigua]
MAFRAMSSPRPGMSPSPWSITLVHNAGCRPLSVSATLLTKKARARPMAVTGGSRGRKSTQTVSGHQMVSAIEGRRVRRVGGGGFRKAGAAASDKVFPDGTDPFTNKFDDAIQASKSRWRDRGGSGSEETPKVIPDIDGKHLVGSARWETIMAKEVDIKNVTPKDRPKIAQLEHGLDRVLFNPGVHWLQDPRSAVYNFTPYLRSICQPQDFDYTALPAYMRPSQDPNLDEMTRLHKAKYMGSTSSMTSILSQFYFLIAAWKPMKMSNLSGVFAYQGKSMEKMLTSTPNEFSRYTKENSWQITPKERNMPEAFNYITVDNFLLRSQLDCEDERLPGRTFDLKTRAAVAIRLDVQNYEQHSGYQLRKSHGFLESFEREYYDMMRSAFLKYSLQVRIGQMDGIFVAFHNTARIFGFQYISLEEMDSRLFGSTVMGNECFRNQLRLLNRTLDEITAKFPEQDLRITVDTHDLSQRMNVWVETLPLGRDHPVTFDAHGAPELQPGAELALWQIVCFSTINGIDTIGPFDLGDHGQDDWILNYKIAQLKRPEMFQEFHRMRLMQADICRAHEREEEAAVAAAASDSEAVKPRSSPASNGLLATIHKMSAQGRQREEEADRLQGDKDVVVWEPKGYVKIEDLAKSRTTLAAAGQPKDSSSNTPPSNGHNTENPVAPRTPSLDTLRSKMSAKLSQLCSDDPRNNSNNNSSSSSSSDSDHEDPKNYAAQETSNSLVTMKVRGHDVTLSKPEYELLMKGKTERLSLQELTALSALHRQHRPLSSAFGYIDDIKTRLRMVPYNPEREQLTRTSMETILRALDEPTDGTDEEVHARVMDKAILGRARLVLEYFHQRVPYITAGQQDQDEVGDQSIQGTQDKDKEEVKDVASPAHPISAVDIASGKVSLENLVRILNGMDAHPRLRQDVKKQDPTLTEEEAAAVVVLSNLYFAERRFSDDDLSKLGFSRIFRYRRMQTGRPLLKLSNLVDGSPREGGGGTAFASRRSTMAEGSSFKRPDSYRSRHRRAVATDSGDRAPFRREAKDTLKDPASSSSSSSDDNHPTSNVSN